MKTAVCPADCTVKNPIPFPNAMTRRQLFHKLLDSLVVAASGMGLAASLMLLLALA